MGNFIRDLRSRGCGVSVRRHQSAGPTKSNIPKFYTAEGFSSHSALLFLLLPRGDDFWRGRRKKGAGSELELREVGRRRRGRMQLSSMASEQNTAERKNQGTREQPWQPPVKTTFTLGVSEETFKEHLVLGLWEWIRCHKSPNPAVPASLPLWNAQHRAPATQTGCFAVLTLSILARDCACV